MAVVPTKYWHQIEDGRIQCDVCPRACKMREGQRGLCSVRGVVGGEVVLLSYGDASGFCIDPIEKKPLNHFLPGTPVLSFGQVGCNLTCSFCQNWSISKHKSDYLEQAIVDAQNNIDIHKTFTQEKTNNNTILNKEILAGQVSQNYDISKSRETDTLAHAATPETIAAAARDLGCRSVAFTYNDPVIFHEYAIDVAAACHAVGVKCVAVTAGYVCAEPRAEFYGHMDAANVDLKGFTESFYKKLCSAELAAVLETLVYLKQETDVWFEITTLLIPGENDSEGEIEALTQWVMENLGPDVPLHFTAFHPDWKMRDTPATPPATLTRARQIALKNGIHYPYTGNVHDPAGASTYCANCDRRLIERDWYELGAWKLDGAAACENCGTVCAGVFDGRPGNWGRKRQAVRLSDFA